MNKILFGLLFCVLNFNSAWGAVVTHGGTLPDSSQKSDFYALIDSATITGIVNADVSSSAAIVASKLDLTSPGAIGSTAASTGKFTTGTFTSITTTGNVGIGTGVPASAALSVFGGNVGIGSSSPGATLDVTGTIRATSFSGATKFKVMTFSRDVSLTSSLTISGVGFTPKAVIFVNAISQNASSPFTVGADDGTTRASGGYAAHSASIVYGNSSSTNSIVLATSDTDNIVGYISSFNSDGFVLNNWTKSGAPTGTATIVALCFG